MSQVVDLYDRDDDRSVKGHPDFCETPTAVQIRRLLNYCQVNGDIGLIVGAPGVGKTMALEQYIKTSRGCWIATASETRRRLTPAMLMVAQAMELHLSNRGAARCRQAIVAEVQYSHLPLLIIDEAGYLDDQPLDELRSIHDQTGMGLVFCGNADFRARLSGTVNRAAFAQLTSRIGMRLTFDAPSREDVAAICDHYGIAKAQERALLEKLVEREGGLRGIARLVHMASALNPERPTITLEDLRSAQSLLNGG